MADLLGADSNQLTEILKDWNDVMRHSSRGQQEAQNTNEREYKSAPRDSRSAVRRRIA